MESPFFTMQNNHSQGCGEPPVFRNTDSRLYYGYFENELGEQWVFVYDRERRKAELRGGDAGWQMAIPVIDGVAIGLKLREDEARWLEVCWLVATGARQLRLVNE
jgi:hypothetical protein